VGPTGSQFIGSVPLQLLSVEHVEPFTAAHLAADLAACDTK